MQAQFDFALRAADGVQRGGGQFLQQDRVGLVGTADQGTGEIYEPGETPAIDPDDAFLKGLEGGQQA